MALKPKFTLKAETPEQEQTLVKTEETPANLTRYMVGTYWDQDAGIWYLTTAKFDPATGAMGEYKATRVGKEWALIREAHDVATSRFNIFEPDDLKEEKK